MTDNFLGIADLATFMQADITDLNESLAELSLGAAQAVIRKYLDQTITLVTDDEVLLDGTNKPWLRLPERPIRSVTTVTVDGSDVTDYEVRRSLIVRSDWGRWTQGNLNVYVKYTHGYDTGTNFVTSDSDSASDYYVPADISLVGLILARRMYDRNFSGEQGEIRSETIGSYSYTLAQTAQASEMTDAERSVLDSYRVTGYG